MPPKRLSGRGIIEFRKMALLGVILVERPRIIVPWSSLDPVPFLSPSSINGVQPLGPYIFAVSGCPPFLTPGHSGPEKLTSGDHRPFAPNLSSLSLHSSSPWLFWSHPPLPVLVVLLLGGLGGLGLPGWSCDVIWLRGKGRGGGCDAGCGVTFTVSHYHEGWVGRGESSSCRGRGRGGELEGE